jgi:hypothetical protein
VILLFSFFGNHLSFTRTTIFLTSNSMASNSMTSLVMAVTTIPVVGLILATRGLARATLEVGQLSEEIFRGDRLPILTFPLEPNDGNDDRK